MGESLYFSVAPGTQGFPKPIDFHIYPSSIHKHGKQRQKQRPGFRRGRMVICAASSLKRLITVQTLIWPPSSMTEQMRLLTGSIL